MTIYALKSRFQALLRPFVVLLVRIGVKANHVTIAACVVSIAIGFAIINAPRIWFAIIPAWMFLRMGFNAIDGMLAREFNQKSNLGAYLNELTDVISDAALYLPFAFVVPFDWRSVGATIFAAALSEMTGVVGVMIGAARRYDGPMGKSDRAFIFGLLGLLAGIGAEIGVLLPWVWAALALLIAATIVNRVRRGLSAPRGS